MTERKNRRQRKKQALASGIIEVAMRLFERQGFDQTTMEQIAEHADVAKATLYKYFPAKEAIVSKYWQCKVAEYHAGIDDLLQSVPDTRTRLIRLLQQSMEHVMANREIYQIYIRYRLQHLFDPQLNQKLRSGSQELFTAIIEAGQKQGEIRNDIPSILLSVNLEFISLTQSLIWFSNPELFNLEKYSGQLVDLFLKGAEK